MDYFDIPYEIGFRYRARCDESIETRFKTVMSALAKLPPPWGVTSYDKNDIPDCSGGLGTQDGFTINRQSKIITWIHYIYRNKSYLEDNPQYDDSYHMSFEVFEDYQAFIRESLTDYIKIIRPYIANSVLCKKLTLNDYDRIDDCVKRGGIYPNFREKILRIQPVNFFDRELCRRAFRLKPEQIAERVKDHVAHVELIADGVLFIYSYDLLERKQIEEIDTKIRPLLAKRTSIFF